MLLLVQKAGTAKELNRTLRLILINRVTATRMLQYNPYSPFMPNALLQVRISPCVRFALI